MTTLIRNDWYGNTADIITYNDFINRINDKKIPSYEMINDTIRYNFDIDMYITKEKYNEETISLLYDTFYDIIFNELLKYTQIEPNIADADSHTKNYDANNGKYSFRYYVSNMKDTRKHIEMFVIYLIENLEELTKQYDLTEDCIELIKK